MDLARSGFTVTLATLQNKIMNLIPIILFMPSRQRLYIVEHGTAKKVSCRSMVYFLAIEDLRNKR